MLPFFYLYTAPIQSNPHDKPSPSMIPKTTLLVTVDTFTTTQGPHLKDLKSFGALTIKLHSTSAKSHNGPQWTTMVATPWGKTLLDRSRFPFRKVKDAFLLIILHTEFVNGFCLYTKVVVDIIILASFLFST